MRTGRAMILVASLCALAGTASAQQRPPPQRHNVTQAEREAARAALDAFTSPTLTRFRDEAEFRRYIVAIDQAERTRGDYYYTYSETSPAPLTTAQASQASAPGQPPSDPSQGVCVETPGHPCTDGTEGEMVTVTGSRVAPPRNPSITNNQMRNVEEGDIIKQIDHYLLILQDGRIFVIDTQAGGTARRPGRALRLTDRMNVYRYVSPNRWNETWYDEMLVSGDRILVTGYSYEAQASELAVFRLDTRTGRLRREGVFRIASNDYYSSSGYATRLIGDNLIIYTPYQIRDMDEVDFTWPQVRRWGPEDDAREQAWLARRGSNWGTPREPIIASGPPLLSGSDIYRPVERTDNPWVHTVSICPLATVGRGALACRSTAMVGPAPQQWYVTAEHAFLWVAGEGDDDETCRDGPAIANARHALVYRVPTTGGGPLVTAARGTPPDQFGLQGDARNLYALVRLEQEGCRNNQRFYGPTNLAFVTIPQAAFSRTRAALPDTAFVALPGTPTPQVAARFTERYLVYGGLSGYRRGLPDPNEFYRYDDRGIHPDDDWTPRRFVGMRASPAVVVPVAHPERFRTLATGHTVIRADRLGDDIILTGYRDRDGLSVTLVGLGGAPRVASSIVLPGRFESEGRSHAFNARQDPDGSSLMGLPTVPRIEDSDRDYWRTKASDLSFLTADRQGRLRAAGELLRRFDYVDRDGGTDADDEDGVPGYQCEVSCTDWYGNSRPVFTDGRIFGLSGTELIEGRMVAGRISELRRLNIALSPPPAR